MPKFDEKSLVEDYFDKALQARGWKSVSADNLERESLEEPLLTANLIRALKKLNADLAIGDEEIKQALNQLKLKISGVEGAKQILNYFKQGIPVKFEKERVVHYVRLFDYDEDKVLNNEFIISRQVIHQTGKNQIRNDIILYVNGIPLVNIECKNPASLTETWYNAYLQIRDYANTTPELYKYVQIGVAAEQTARYFAIAPWQQEETKTHQWREPNKDAIDSTIDMLNPTTLLNIIKNYLFFKVEYGGTTKVVTRYMQYRAAEKICDRVTNYLEGNETKNKGLVWHWQGSGKTLTMIFAANKLFYEPVLANPSLIFIVDREDLQEQLFTEYTALETSPKPELANSIEGLRSFLTQEDSKGKRGVFIALIQKFRPEEFKKLQEELEALSKKQETILTRKNVVVFVDEGHRSQYGTLAGQMKDVLKNAAIFAFTGTPIAIKQRNTYREFSYPDEKYLDKYFITDSVQDGFTLRISYQPRLEKDVHLNREMLDTFIQVEFEEIPEEFREPVKDKVKKKLNEINVRLERPDRIELIAEDIARHFKENVDGKFKAMVVAASRLACVRYKKELDKLLPKEYCEVVMSPTKSREEEVQAYLKALQTRYFNKEPGEVNKEIITKFKEDPYPKILIVTDMLLTGFDAPILQTMYLDKPIKEHRLLQAVARTNRPYKDLKETGLIIDYVGIIDKFRKALENYSKEDMKDALVDMDDLRKEFLKILNETLGLFENIPKDQYDLGTMRKAIETITINEQNTKKFLENYVKLRKLFEILGSDVAKIEKFSEFMWLSKVYVYYVKMVLGGNPIEDKYVKKYFDKTLKYVYVSTKLEDLQKQLPIISFDENYLKNLEEKVKSKEEKAANIVFTLNRFILVERERNPIYETLAEKVEKILQHWRERTKDYEKIYEEGTGIIQELRKLEERKTKLGFSFLEYGVLLTLERQFGSDQSLIQDTKELVNNIKPLMFKDWYIQPSARKTIEREVRRYIRKYIKQYGLNLKQLEELYRRMMDNVKPHGQKA